MKQIYFVRRADGTGPIKIGCSAYLNTRLYQFGVDYRAKFALLASVPGDFITERNIHLKFSAIHADVPSRRAGRGTPIGGHSEWFKPTATLLRFIEVVRTTGEIPLSKAECRERIFAERYLAGETLQQIAADYDITRERVRQILRRAGVESLGLRPEHKRNAHDLTPAEIAAVHDYGAGEFSSVICERHGLSRHALLQACRRMGVATRSAGAPFRSDFEATCREVARLYRQGASLDQIRQRFGWAHITYVYRWLKRAGVTPTRKPRLAKAA